MNSSGKPYPTWTDYARALQQEASFGEARADTLARTALKIERDGDLHRAKALWYTCRKLRVQALLDRSRASAAEALGRSRPKG